MKETINYKKLATLLFVAIISIYNLIFLYQKPAAYLLCVLEIIILLAIFVCGREVDYFCCYLIFLCLSFEFAQFVREREIFNFRNLKILGVNMSIWAQLPLYIKFLFSKNLKINRPLKIGVGIFISLQLLSLVVGGFSVFVFNDNNTFALESVYKLFFSEFAFYGCFTFGLILGCFLSFGAKDGVQQLKNCLYLIIFGVCIQTIFSRIFSLYSWYGEFPMLLVSNVSFIFPLFLLLPLYDWKNFPKPLALLVLVTNILLVCYNANGKFYLYLFIVLFIYVIKLIKMAIGNKRYIPLIFLMACFCAVAVIAFVIFRDKYGLLSYKFDQALQLINIFDKDWFADMSDSPKTRIVEFICIGKELLKKPQYLLFGKGFLGTIKDYLGFFEGKIDNSLFSAAEFKIDAYYNMHESFNVIFLQNGVVGLALLVFVSIAGLFKRGRNVFVLIGTIWLLSNYGYSNCITAVGVCFLVIGWNDYFNKKQPNKIDSESRFNGLLNNSIKKTYNK